MCWCVDYDVLEQVDGNPHWTVSLGHVCYRQADDADSKYRPMAA
jgi:hypothetical protein